MQKLDKNEVGMVLSGFAVLFHFVWLIFVGFGWAQSLLDFVLNLHHISLSYYIMNFSWGYAVGLLVYAAVMGYVIGWVFAAIWNYLRK